jgi:NAD(P) transhydrogenase subunit alpha
VSAKEHKIRHHGGARSKAADAQDARGYGRAQDESFYSRPRELLSRIVAESDVVITGAVVPGKKSQCS